MKIVAIGGGEIGRPGHPVETTEIDREIIRLTGCPSPHLLFIPTASSDAPGYVSVVHEHFGGRLGCEVDELLLLDGKLTREEIKQKIDWADAVYVGGGNTGLLLDTWREYGVDKLLIEAGERGTVLSGLSAGAICWFEQGLSDSMKFDDPNAPFLQISGLGVVPGLFCPHYDVEPDRKGQLEKLVNVNPKMTVYAAENCAAIEYIDGDMHIVRSKPEAKVYKIFENEGYLIEEEIN